MNESEPEKTIRRILVALDASTHSLAALEVAADLAASLQAELIGLFVEDVNLLYFAGLPFAHEVRSPSATRQPVSSDHMEHQMQLQASQARRALEAAAERTKTQWSFRIVRGQVTAAILDAALDADLLALGRIGWPVSRRARLGSTARAATTEFKRSILLIQQGRVFHYPILVTYDGTAGSRQALTAGAKLAQSGGGNLNVLLIGDSKEATESLKQEVTGWLKERELSVSFRRLAEPTASQLATLVRAIGDCIVILGGDNPLMAADALQELLDATDCPILLMR